MKRILFLFLPFLPYLASAQVAKDTVTVLTLAQIPAGAIRDTTNITFVQDNAFAKANFDSLAKYTRVKLQTYTLDSTHITASGLNLQGTRFTGVLPVTRGGTGQESLALNKVLVGNGTSGVLAPSELTYSATNPKLAVDGWIKTTAISVNSDRANADGGLFFNKFLGDPFFSWFEDEKAIAQIRGSRSGGDAFLYISDSTGAVQYFTVKTLGTTVGNVGISTATPTSNLEVAQPTTGSGTVSITNGSTTVTGSGTQFTNTFKVGDAITISGQTVRTITAIINDTSLTVNTAYPTTASNLTYTLTGGTRFVVRGNGNVGIGTSSPNGQLTIKSSGLDNGLINFIASDGSNLGVLYEDGSGSALLYLRDMNSNADALINANGNSYLFEGNFGLGNKIPSERLHVTGNARITALSGTGSRPVNADANGVLSATSSIQIKQNVEPINYGLPQVMALTPVCFDYKDKYKWGEGRDIGFVAEDVFNVVPESTGTMENGDIYFDLQRLIPVLTKAIQEQQQQIEALKARITQLENK